MNPTGKIIPNESTLEGSPCDDNDSDRVRVKNEEPLEPSILANVDCLLERCSEVLEEM